MKVKILERFLSIVSESGTRVKILKGVGWAFLGTLISKGLLFTSFIIIAHYLSIENYGKLGIIRTTISTFSLFSIASFGVTATKYLALFVKENQKKALEILSMTRVFVTVFAFLISIGVFFLSEFIASSILKDPTLSFAVQISSIGIFFTSMNGLQTGILAGLEKFKYISFINVTNGIISFFILLLSIVNYGFEGGVVALAGIQLLLWIESLFFLRKSFREENLSFKLVNFSNQLPIVKEFTLPTFLSGIIVPPVLYTCEIFITNIDNGFSQLGIYKAAFNFSVITITLNGIMGQVLYPFVMKNVLVKSRNLEFFNQISPFLIGVLLNLPFLLLPELFATFFGENYEIKDMYLSIVFISLSTIIISHRQGISRNFASKNYMWWSVIGNSTWAVCALVVVFFLADYGAIGISFGLFTAYALNTAVFIPFYIKKGLIEKKDLFNKFSVSIWLMVFGSCGLTFLDAGLLVKICFSVIIVLLVILLGFKWISKEMNIKINV